MKTRTPILKPGLLPTLSLHQPWASLAVWGVKTNETRDWRTDYRGPVVIHAAKCWDSTCRYHANQYEFKRALMPRLHLEAHQEHLYESTLKNKLPFGALVGMVTITDCIPSDDERWFDWGFLVSPEYQFGCYDSDRSIWTLSNPIVFDTPIPWKGGQGWFHVPEDLVR